MRAKSASISFSSGSSSPSSIWSASTTATALDRELALSVSFQFFSSSSCCLIHSFSAPRLPKSFNRLSKSRRRFIATAEHFFHESSVSLCALFSYTLHNILFIYIYIYIYICIYIIYCVLESSLLVGQLPGNTTHAIAITSTPHTSRRLHSRRRPAAVGAATHQHRAELPRQGAPARASLFYQPHQNQSRRRRRGGGLLRSP